MWLSFVIREVTNRQVLYPSCGTRKQKRNLTISTLIFYKWLFVRKSIRVLLRYRVQNLATHFKQSVILYKRWKDDTFDICFSASWETGSKLRESLFFIMMILCELLDTEQRRSRKDNAISRITRSVSKCEHLSTNVDKEELNVVLIKNNW